MEFHLLIVDDEPPIRKGLSHFIQWDAIDCVVEAVACNGLEAMEIVKSQKVDIVITDIKMPEANGIMLAKFLYEEYPEIPVIILTGYADFEYAQSAIRYHVVDFVLKPTSKDKLIDAVKKAQEQLIISRKNSSLVKDDLIFIKEQLLQELTDMSIVTPAVTSKLGSYGITMHHYFVISYQLLTEDLSTGSTELLSLKNAISCQSASIYCYRYNQLLLSIYTMKQDCETLPPWVINQCQEAIEMAEALYNQKLSIGVSQLHHGYTELPAAATEAIQALSLNFYNSNPISQYEGKTATGDYNSNAEFTLMLLQLETLLLDWKFEEGAALCASIFYRAKLLFIAEIDVRNLCTQIFYICSRVLVKKDLSPLPAQRLKAIHNAANLSELETEARDFLNTLKSSFLNSGRKFSHIVEQSIQYIHQNLGGNLSLESIADYIHVNPSHLSRTFKKECDKTITDYVNRARIEKAQELLSLSDTLAYEVAEKAGFNDPAYFSAIFKKYTGMSPKEYRQLHTPSTPG